MSSVIAHIMLSHSVKSKTSLSKNCKHHYQRIANANHKTYYYAFTALINLSLVCLLLRLTVYLLPWISVTVMSLLFCWILHTGCSNNTLSKYKYQIHILINIYLIIIQIQFILNRLYEAVKIFTKNNTVYVHYDHCHTC